MNLEQIVQYKGFWNEMYKNLLYLKNYTGNVEDLGLDFTIVNSEIGQTQVNQRKNSFRNNKNRHLYLFRLST